MKEINVAGLACRYSDYDENIKPRRPFQGKKKERILIKNIFSRRMITPEKQGHF